MAHAYRFDPPLRGNCKGPTVKMRLEDPVLEKKLQTKRMDDSPAAPYRKDNQVENLVDQMTFGVQPKTADEGILMLTCGFALKMEKCFKMSPHHIHETSELMRPNVLLSHSKSEGKTTIIDIRLMDELSILSVSILRSLGFPSYLSTVKTPAGTYLSGAAVLSDAEVTNFLIFGQHPSVEQLVLFEDKEVLHLLSLLDAHNNLRKLLASIRGNRLTSEQQEQYDFIRKEFAYGCLSGHHLSVIMEKFLSVFNHRFPDEGPEKAS